MGPDVVMLKQAGLSSQCRVLGPSASISFVLVVVGKADE